jgi:chromosome partitioning protein
LRTIAVYNIKGGVGKTATAVNLAFLSAASGLRTLLWDLDPQGAASFYFRVDPKVKGGARELVRGRKPIARVVRESDYEGLDLLPADFSYRNLDLTLSSATHPRTRLAEAVRPFSGDYDHFYIDCAPSISLVSEGVFHAADVLLVPTIPTTLSLRTLEQLKQYMDRDGPSGLRVLPFFCMVDQRRALHREIVDGDSRGPWEFLNTRIPYASVVEQMGRRRAPVAAYAPTSEAARAYRELWQEVLDRTGSLLGWSGWLMQKIGFR